MVHAHWCRPWGAWRQTNPNWQKSDNTKCYSLVKSGGQFENLASYECLAGQVDGELKEVQISILIALEGHWKDNATES
eukprot:1160586-Pelagomonas_calceolata.AAC.1